jgi:hypothetical protein
LRELTITHSVILTFSYQWSVDKKYLILTNIILVITKPSLSSSRGMAVIDLFRPRLEVCSKVFQVVFGHLFYNSPLFLASSCCSCLLNVVANFICIFFISHPLVLLSSIPEFLYLFCDQNRVSCCSSETFLLDRCHSFFIPLSDGPNFASMWKNGKHQGIIPLYS